MNIFRRKQRKKLFIISLGILFIGIFFLLRNSCETVNNGIEIADHKMTIDDVDTYYRTAGDSAKQPIVFLHGWGARLGKYCGTDGVIETLAEHFYVIAPEQPGLIRSEAPKTVWNYEEYTVWLHEFLKKLNIKRPILIGQSFGGGTATIYAKTHPGYVKTLILVDAVLSERPRNFYLKALESWSIFYPKFFASRFIPRFIKKTIINLYFGTPWKNIDDENIQGKIIMGEINFKRKVEVDYKELKMPLILVWGRKDTFVAPLKRAEEIHREVQGSKLILVDGGHTVLYQKPSEVVITILNSL